MVDVACSNNAFRLQSDSDVSNLLMFFGRVYDRLTFLLNDSFDHLVPPPAHWILLQCDVNRDIEISPFMQVTLPVNVQLKFVERVFRLYVKTLSDKATYRVEESLQVKAPLLEALNALHDPDSSYLKIILHKLDLVLKRLPQERKEELSSCGQH